MSDKVTLHYNLDPIAKTGANYYLIYGKKSNGKSYQVKHKKAIIHYLETGKRFILLRRWKEDISNLWIEQYFSDVDVEKLTDGKYNCIVVYRKTLYFGNYNHDTSKTIKGEKIGYVMALSTEQHYSGGSFLDVDVIIFEEFMERGSFIAHEPDKLMILYNTVDRQRGVTELWMVGNTISRINPYVREWGLKTTLNKMKQGDIEVVEFKNVNTITNEVTVVKIAMEYCRDNGGKKMAIGSASSMIDDGGWQVLPQPALPKSRKLYKRLYRVGFEFEEYRFMAEYLKDIENKDKCWFVYPREKEFTNKRLLVVSDVIKTDKYWIRDIYSPTIKNERIKRILSTFREGKIFYSDFQTGTEFKEAIDFSIRK